MFGLIDIIYSRLRRNEIIKAKFIIKKIRTDTIFDSITKSCWKYSIQYETLLRNQEILDVKLKGRKEIILFRFHKVDMVFIEDYQRFTNNMEVHGVKRGVYITTGVFERKIINEFKKIIPVYRPVKMINNFDIAKSKLGLFGTSAEVFKHSKLKLFKYLPT